MRDALLLPSLQRYADASLLLMRVAVGSFLVWGVWDNISSSDHMQEFVNFLAKFGFPAPAFMARLSVWVQFVIGILFVLGGLTRWAGILCAVNFAVAIAMVDRFAGVRGAFASACLILIGLYLATRGAGRFSLDQRLLTR
jgi:putative oxidoreductase